MEVTIRDARAEDRTAVLGFCVDTFDWGDYIAEVWDEWLSDPSGRLMVAESGGIPVGLQHVVFPTPGQAWLQGLRVDPAVRRQGVAKTLFEAGISWARENGATAARLLTKVDNETTHHMMQAAGFRRLLTYTDLRAPANQRFAQTPEKAVLADQPDIWRLLDDSEQFREGERTYLWQWRCRVMTPDLLRHHLEDGDVYVIRADGKPQAAALVEWWPEDPSLWATTFCGDMRAISRLAVSLRVQAANVAAKEVAAYVPVSVEVVEGLRRAGYESGSGRYVPDMDLFVKDFPGDTP